MTGKSAKKGADAAEQESAALAEINKRLSEALARTEETEKKVNDVLDAAMRIQADFDNYRKRMQRENEEFKKYANESLISELLGVVDDLERALAHADAKSDLAIGVNAIRQNLMKILAAKGLSEIKADGKFNPNLHEALCTVPGEEDGNIAEVLLKGYRIGDRVLRCTKVKVTKKQKEEGQAEEGEQKCQG